MLSLWRWLQRLQRQPRSRATELLALRARFAAQPSRRQAGEPLRRQAEALAQLRQQLCQAYGRPAACARCAAGHPLPNGRFDGGHCCGSPTASLFTPPEVASLKLAGVTPSRLTVPRSDIHAGCVFRGAEGCSLEPRLRPNVCVRHVCQELRSELRQRPDWAYIGELRRALHRAFEAFVAELAAPDSPGLAFPDPLTVAAPVRGSPVAILPAPEPLLSTGGPILAERPPAREQRCISCPTTTRFTSLSPATSVPSRQRCSSASPSGSPLPDRCSTSVSARAGMPCR